MSQIVLVKLCGTCGGPTRRRVMLGYVCFGCAGIYSHTGKAAF